MERLDAFMARANAAFYANLDPYAEFTTAPEISQVFGELLGAWAAEMWRAMGSPDPVMLAELGPGRGTLMADALRAARGMPSFEAALRVHFVETSPRLRALQERAVPPATWHDEVASLPEGPVIVLANEFFDALPIRQFIRDGEGWTERYVSEGAAAAVPSDPPTDAPDGDVFETCDPARAIVALLAARIVRRNGAVLIIDYGPAESAAGDSLQALRGGAPADPFGEPGSADLTAHVDFAALARVARAAGASTYGPLPQGMFLARLGLYQRTGVLARTLPPARAGAMIESARRLAEPDRMGRLFKALAICHPALPPPPGFET
jgi:SAM-dependent MidA family methyltransferase